MDIQDVPFGIVQDTITAALSHYPEHRPTIERAALLIVTRRIVPPGAMMPTLYAVLDDVDVPICFIAGGTAALRAGGCICADKRPAISCRHEWAVDLIQAASHFWDSMISEIVTAERFPQLSETVRTNLNRVRANYIANEIARGE